MSDDDDITRRYHKDHPHSAEASKRSAKERDRNELYEFTFRQGLHGSTADEADAALGKGHQTTSARFSDLKRSGDLIDTGSTRLTRKNCKAAVFVAKPLWEAPPIVAEPPAPEPAPKTSGAQLRLFE